MKVEEKDFVFVAQDIDLTVALTCYVQLTLLGCAGYVIVGNSLMPTPPPRESVWQLPMNIFQKKLLEAFHHST